MSGDYMRHAPNPNCIRADAADKPVAVRYRNGLGRWRYLNFPFTKGWDFPPTLGTLEFLYATPQAASPQEPSPAPLTAELKCDCGAVWAPTPYGWAQRADTIASPAAVPAPQEPRWCGSGCGWPSCRCAASPAAPQELAMWQCRNHGGEWAEVKASKLQTVAERVAELQGYIAEGHRYELRALMTIAASPAAVNADARDAARYRWLRERDITTEDIGFIDYVPGLGHDGSRLDAAIDAAMGAAKEQDHE